MGHGHGYGQFHPEQSRGYGQRIFMSGIFGQILYDHIILYYVSHAIFIQLDITILSEFK